MKKKCARIVAAATGALLALTTAPAAQALPNYGKEMVTFGDSFTANGGTPGRGVPSAGNGLKPCWNDSMNWAHQTARKLKHDLADYSCNGTSVWVDAYVTDAIVSRHIGPRTKEVVFMYGGLQPGSHVDAVANAAAPDVPKSSTYRGLLEAQFRKIRAVAPNARITMTNYLPMTVNDVACIVNAGPGLRVNTLVPGATTYEETYAREIGNAAAALNVNFIDVHSKGKTHDACQPNPKLRWTTIVPTPDAPATMPAHPTDAGHTGMANIISAALRR